MPSSNITGLTNLATPQPTMLLYAALSPFGVTDDRKVTANALLATITANISDISLQFDNGLGTATVAAAGKGKIRYNNTTKTFQASVDGGVYADLGGGGGMAIGGAIAGGATAGSVLFVGAGPVLAQDNASFFWDVTNHRLGIGTTAPADQLHIQNTAGSGLARIESTNGQYGRLELKSNTRQWSVLVGGGGTFQSGTYGVYDDTGGGSLFPFFIQSSHRIGVNIDPFNTLGSTIDVQAAVANEPVLTLRDNTVGGSGSTMLNLLKFVNTNNAVNNTVLLDISVFGGNGANGLGGAILGRLRSTTTEGRNATACQWLWTNATDASRSAAYAIQIVDNANALAEMWRIAGNGAGSGTLETLSGVNGSQMVTGEISENLTLNVGATTTDTTMQLPANSIILSVTTRVTTTITTAVSFSVGDPTTAARFSASAGGLTAGSTRVGLDHMQGSVTTNATGPVQTTAASVRITTNANPGAGAIRITIHYLQFIPPTS